MVILIDQIKLQVRNGGYMVRNSRNCNFVSTDKPVLGGWPVNLISYLQKIKI